jgi:hypothetical protein
VAVIRWGEVRATRDVDVTLITGFGEEEPFVDAILGAFRPRIPAARDFALRNRVILATAPNGVDVDVSLGGIPFEERLVERASPFLIGDGVEVRTCSAEDLVVLKAFADRQRDWTDIEGVVARQGSSLDWRTTFDELAVLAAAKEDPTILDRLRQVLRANGIPSP